MEITLTTFSQADSVLDGARVTARAIQADDTNSGGGQIDVTRDADGGERGTTFAADDNRAALRELNRLIAEAAAQGVTTRALGGAGVALMCDSARWPNPLARGYSDVDLVVGRKEASRLGRLLEEQEYLPDERFNTINGTSRLSFSNPTHGHLDVFVEDFAMCHRLKLGGRLHLHAESISPADLLLTKLQIATMTAKDVADIAALLADLPASQDDTGVNVNRVLSVLNNDWGWWRTVTENLLLVREQTRELPTSPEFGARIRDRIATILSEVERGPKSMRWKMRARLGDRVPWREEPEAT
jgi:hypothetical protein